MNVDTAQLRQVPFQGEFLEEKNANWVTVHLQLCLGMSMFLEGSTTIAVDH